MLPYLLFAYREVPQESTGFSPFELLYGRKVRGPLDILKETWETRPNTSESVVSHLLDVRENLETMTEIAHNNLLKSQKRQKVWYDRQARERSFSVGDKVLVLLPTSTNKLQAEWQGPYVITKKMGPVDYQVDMKDRRKRLRIYHINMLRGWYTSEATSFCVEAIDETLEEEVELPGFTYSGKSQEDWTINPELTDKQEAELTQLLIEHKDVLRDSPGYTTLVEHHIATGEHLPVRQRPYRLPYSQLPVMRAELDKMLELGVIEPSHSEWSSPVVMVPKKDGTTRFCVDYRRLNTISKFDCYPLPRVDEIIDRLGKARYISTLDLTKGYWQVPVGVDSQSKTAFCTPFGLFQFKTMPFGLHGAPATFQRLIDRILQGAEEKAVAFIDDIAIYSES